MKTVSEKLFEDFLIKHNISFKHIPRDTTPTPDYLVEICSVAIAFEITELRSKERKDFVYSDDLKPIGSHIRQKIIHKKHQVKCAEKQNIASVLIIYNEMDPVFQRCGTEYIDFEAAMYGDLTLTLDKTSKKVLEFIMIRILIFVSLKIVDLVLWV